MSISRLCDIKNSYELRVTLNTNITMNTINTDSMGVNVWQGTSDFFQQDMEPTKKIIVLKEKLRDFFNLKNVNFLLGSGTSSDAIPTMKELYETLDFNENEEEQKKEFDNIAQGAQNLEHILCILYSAQTYFQGIVANEAEKSMIDNKRNLYNELIHKIENHIYDKINIDFNSEKAAKILRLYKTFYQKIALRNKDNSRIRIFTTNNDLFNETALDELNIHYINGFSGGLHKFFNPAFFNYTWSKRMDTSIDKYEPVENLVYLYKLHGSVNWAETIGLKNNFFEIEEVSPSKTKPDGSILIYPTPTKQDKSLGAPYIDLFREFQNKLLEPNSVLFIIGYSFSDRHVNDIIYRALATNSTINIVIFGENQPLKENTEYKPPIFSIDDSRIFIINGKIYADADLKNVKTIHHFDYIVNNLLPNLDELRNDEKILNKFVEQLKNTIKKNENRENHSSGI